MTAQGVLLRDREQDRGTLEQPEALLEVIRSTDDPATLSWVASAVVSHLHSGVPWRPDDVAAVLAHRIQGLAAPGPGAEGQRLQDPEREAASVLLEALLELVHRSADAREHVRRLLAAEVQGGPDLLGSLLRVIAGPGGERLLLSLDRTSRGAPAQPTSAKSSACKPAVSRQLDPDSRCGGAGGVGGAALVYACQLLALIAQADKKVAKDALAASTLDLVGGRLLHATRGIQLKADAAVAEDGAGTEWHPFATAAVVLIDALVCQEDDDRLQLARPEFFEPGWARYERTSVAVDACVAALKRSLLTDGGSVVAHQLHICGLRALSRIVRFNKGQASRIISSKALRLGIDVLSIDGTDEEAALVALGYLADVAAACPSAQRDLVASGAAQAVQRTADRYSRSGAVKAQALRVSRACRG